MPGRSTLNTTALAEQVPEIEQYIRVIKERARAIWISLPLKKLPGRIVIDMILFVVLWIN